MTLFRFTRERRHSLAAFILFALFVVQAVGQAAAPAAAKLSAAELELTEKITIASIKEMTSALASPEMEGRGTGQPGGDKAAVWIADRFKSLGLKPLGDKGSYLQKVDFKESTASEASFTFGDQSLASGTEFALQPHNNGNKNISGDMVFVSYGIQSKQANIDMLEGANLSGKVVVMIEGPPPGFPKKSWDDQKAQMAIVGSLIRAGVVALVFIGQGGEEEPPEIPISYFSRRQIMRPDEQGYPTVCSANDLCKRGGSGEVVFKVGHDTKGSPRSRGHAGVQADRS